MEMGPQSYLLGEEECLWKKKNFLDIVENHAKVC